MRKSAAANAALIPASGSLGRTSDLEAAVGESENFVKV
jgi:hypothetical protein